MTEVRWFNPRLSALAMAALVAAALAGMHGCSSKRGASDGADMSESGPAGKRDYLSESDLAARQAGRFNGSSIPTAEGDGPFRDVPFEYDSSAIRPNAYRVVEENAALLRENPSVRVTLEGHCDSRGTEEYNLTLGEARARAVKDALVALGISPSRIDTVTYGENIPLALGDNEEAWAQNRRVHFAASSGERSPWQRPAPQSRRDSARADEPRGRWREETETDGYRRSERSTAPLTTVDEDEAAEESPSRW